MRTATVTAHWIVTSDKVTICADIVDLRYLPHAFLSMSVCLSVSFSLFLYLCRLTRDTIQPAKECSAWLVLRVAVFCCSYIIREPWELREEGNMSMPLCQDNIFILRDFPQFIVEYLILVYQWLLTSNYCLKQLTQTVIVMCGLYVHL